MIFLALAATFGLSLAILWRSGWRWAALYAGLMVASLAGAVELQGGPKAIWLEWRDTTDMEVVAVQFIPGAAIYVWIAGDTPRAYAMPWSAEDARELQERMREGNPYRMDYENGELVTYPAPVLPSPPKP